MSELPKFNTYVRVDGSVGVSPANDEARRMYDDIVAKNDVVPVVMAYDEIEQTQIGDPGSTEDELGRRLIAAFKAAAEAFFAPLPEATQGSSAEEEKPCSSEP